MLDLYVSKMASSNIVTTRVVKLRKGSHINILQIIYKEEIYGNIKRKYKEYGGRYLLNLHCRSKIISNEHTEHVSHTMSVLVGDNISLSKK